MTPSRHVEREQRARGTSLTDAMEFVSRSPELKRLSPAMKLALCQSLAIFIASIEQRVLEEVKKVAQEYARCDGRASDAGKGMLAWLREQAQERGV